MMKLYLYCLSRFPLPIGLFIFHNPLLLFYGSSLFFSLLFNVFSAENVAYAGTGVKDIVIPEVKTVNISAVDSSALQIQGISKLITNPHRDFAQVFAQHNLHKVIGGSSNLEKLEHEFYHFVKVFAENDSNYLVLPVKTINKYETVFVYKEGAVLDLHKGHISIVKLKGICYIYEGEGEFCRLPPFETAIYETLISYLNSEESMLKCPAGDVLIHNFFTEEASLLEFKTKITSLKNVSQVSSSIPLQVYLKSSQTFFKSFESTTLSQVKSLYGGSDLIAQRTYNHLIRLPLVSHPSMYELKLEILLRSVRLALMYKLNFIKL